MTQIATKFVKWDIPELATLQDSKVYKLRVHLNNGGKLNREEKNWITRNVWESPQEVLAFRKPWNGDRCVYLDSDAYWFPDRPDQLTLLSKKGAE